VIVLYVLLLACTEHSAVDSSAAPEEIPFVSPDEEGPYDAGLHSFSFVSDRGRELFVDVWYPAVRGELDMRATYEPFSFRGQAYRDVPVARTETSLIAFSHGLLSVRFQNATLCEHLAQHGYTVIAPDHPGTHIFNLSDTILAEDVFVRSEDIQRTVDAFWQKSQDDQDPMYNIVSSEEYIAMGHSLGSHTVMALGGAEYDYDGFMSFCAEFPNEQACRIGADISREEMESFESVDPRVYASIPMSPGLWYTFGEGLSSLRSPLFVTGKYDQVLEYETEAIPTMDHAPQDAPELHYPNTGHYGFTEMCTLMPAFSEECSDTTGQYTDPEFLIQSLQAVVLAYIKGDIEGNTEYSDWIMGQDWSEDMLIYRP
jgi:predicted dienelactone hydrolase